MGVCSPETLKSLSPEQRLGTRIARKAEEGAAMQTIKGAFKDLCDHAGVLLMASCCMVTVLVATVATVYFALHGVAYGTLGA